MRRALLGRDAAQPCHPDKTHESAHGPAPKAVPSCARNLSQRFDVTSSPRPPPIKVYAALLARSVHLSVHRLAPF